MSGRLALFLGSLVVVGACSPAPERATALSPTSPSGLAGSLLGPSPVAPGGVSGPMDVTFPGRNDTFDFRLQLEPKYQVGLGRPASTSFVDREGDVVWTQEYIRYRVNGCDHGSALQRVFAQIDGNPPGQICGAASTGEIGFPSRVDTFDFRRQLESKYQLMGRGLSSSFVDIEGAVIWTQEYLRYRLNSCDHATAIQKVFGQIDGNGVAPTCFVATQPVACNYRLTPDSVGVGAIAAAYLVELFAIPGGCDWTVTSNASWLTVPAPTTGNGSARVTYNVATNTGAARTGTLTFSWTGGSVRHTVNQTGSPFNVQFQMFDPGRTGSSATTRCDIRTAPTPCNFVATANLIGAQTFTWTATYFYGIQKTVTQTGASANFGFTDACGGTGSTAAGSDVDLDVTLTVTDTLGNSQTVRSGQGSSPALVLRRHTC